MASIRCLGRAGALLGLCLPHTVASAWLGDRRSSSSLPLSFGYALPSRSAYSPLSFYPPNAPPPPEETHFAEAVEAARQARVRRMERYPAFPETPTALAREISGSIAAMVQAHARAAAEASAAPGSEEDDRLGFPTSTPRLRVDLQLDDLFALGEDWSRAVSHRYLPFYEKVLLTLRVRGYKKVLAVFGFRQEAHFVEKRLRQAGALGGIRVEHLAGREGSSKFIDVGNPDLVVFFNPQTVNGDELSEFQRAVAVSTIRGAPVVLVNPALSAFSFLPRGLDVVRPMILSDFEPCFQVSAHAYRYNPSISYSILRRGGGAFAAAASPASVEGQEEEGRVLSKGPWEVFALDRRLPGSGWAYLDSREEEPFRLEIESKYFDSCFFISKPSSAPTENPFREADYADYSDKGLAH